MRIWKWIRENQKRFLSKTDSFTKPSLIFATAVIIWEFEFIFVAYFQGLNYLIISCFSRKFAARIPINWRGNFTTQEIFLFITYSFKKTSLRFCTSVLDWDIWWLLWDPNFHKFAKFPQIRFAIFGLIVFKYFELSCN